MHQVWGSLEHPSGDRTGARSQRGGLPHGAAEESFWEAKHSTPQNIPLWGGGPKRKNNGEEPNKKSRTP